MNITKHKYWDIEEESQQSLIKLSLEGEKEGWKLVKQDGDIYIYQKRLSPSDSIDCVKAIVKLDYPAQKVKDVVYHRISVRKMMHYYNF